MGKSGKPIMFKQRNPETAYSKALRFSPARESYNMYLLHIYVNGVQLADTLWASGPEEFDEKFEVAND